MNKEDKDLEIIVCIHHIATFISAVVGCLVLIKGTGSRIKDTLAGCFFVTQLYAVFKILAEVSGNKKDTMASRLRHLVNRLKKEKKGRLHPEAGLFFSLLLSLLFKIGIPLSLLER